MHSQKIMMDFELRK